MAFLKPIKNLNDNYQSIIELLKEYVIGSKDLTPYITTKTYNKGDSIISFNTTTNRYEILHANRDTITGTYNSTYWEKNVIDDMVTGDVVNKRIITIGATNPNDPSNLLWYVPDTTSKSNSATVKAVKYMAKLDGENYIELRPVNTSEEVYINGTSTNLTNYLANSDAHTATHENKILDDVFLVINTLRGFMPKPLQLNYMQFYDFDDVTNIVLTTGGSIPGKLFI